jgi:hypothetical protein
LSCLISPVGVVFPFSAHFPTIFATKNYHSYKKIKCKVRGQLPWNSYIQIRGSLKP